MAGLKLVFPPATGRAAPGLVSEADRLWMTCLFLWVLPPAPAGSRPQTPGRQAGSQRAFPRARKLHCLEVHFPIPWTLLGGEGTPSPEVLSPPTVGAARGVPRGAAGCLHGSPTKSAARRLCVQECMTSGKVPLLQGCARGSPGQGEMGRKESSQDARAQARTHTHTGTHTAHTRAHALRGRRPLSIRSPC